MVGVLKIFALGIGILLVAIALNAVASLIGLKTWYEFVKKPTNTSILSYFWLFMVYPFGLGLAAYLLSKLFRP